MVGYKSRTMELFFLFFGILLVIVPLSPSGLTPNKTIIPDFLFCFIFTVLVRNPKKISLFSIIFICLLSDLLWYQPLGLIAFTFVLGSELLRQYLFIRDKIGLFEEVICISGIYILMTSIQEVIKFFTLIPSLSFGEIVTYVLVTLFLYSLVTLVIRISGKSSLL